MPLHRLHRTSRPECPPRDAEALRQVRHDPDAARSGRSWLSVVRKMVLPIAVQRGMGVQGMKSTANSRLLHSITLKDCLSYVLSLPIHGLALGCTTLGQIEDDVRIAQQFKPLSIDQMAALRTRADQFKGPELENWKRNTHKAEAAIYRDGVLA